MNLGPQESTQGDSRVAVFIPTSGLKVVLGTDLLQHLGVLAQHGHAHVHTGAQCGAQVGRAERQVAEPVHLGELHFRLHVLDGLQLYLYLIKHVNP